MASRPSTCKGGGSREARSEKVSVSVGTLVGAVRTAAHHYALRAARRVDCLVWQCRAGCSEQ
jgi:hypothetical protein